jgi:membrane-bound ClpP family serine protease
MDRNRVIAIAAGIALAAFLLGFLPQWTRANGLRDRLDASRQELAAARHEVRMAQVEGQIGAALAEAQRSNYEQARQRMTEVYSELQAATPALQGAQRRTVDAILAERDEMVTLLARAAPESRERLMLVYTRYHNAFHPAAARAPITPVP